jgi:YgiT-type zinc finger domain-containing protein
MSLPAGLHDELEDLFGTRACARCGGELERGQELDRLVRHGNDVALVRVRADVCSLCGEVLLNPGMTGVLMDARDVLRQGRAGWAAGCVYDLRRGSSTGR